MAHKIKITLNHSEPKIYRTVIVPEHFTFAALHQVIQLVMNWENCHLFEFCIRSKAYSGNNIALPADDNDSWAEKPCYNALQTTITEILNLGHKKIIYTYDFGDSWEHTLTFLQKPKEEVLYPKCIDAAEIAPIEDCGGIGGFYYMLDLLNSNKKEDAQEKKELKEWIGLSKKEKYQDLYAFDIDEINSTLISNFQS